MNRDREIDIDENFDNENVFNDNDMAQFVHEHEGNDPDHIENISFADFDYNQLIACANLDLREKYRTTTEASCFVSEKVSHILQLENKVRHAMFQESIRRNNPNFVINHETETLLTCESPFSIAFKKFSGKKTLNEFIKNKLTLLHRNRSAWVLIQCLKRKIV